MIDFAYTIIRSPRRKTVGITVHPDNTVTVRVPRTIDERVVRGLLDKKSGWVRRKLAANLTHREKYRPKEYREGEEFLFLGKKYFLEKSSRDGEVTLCEDRMLVGRSSRSGGNERGLIAARIEDWYRKQALDYLSGRVRFFREIVGVSPEILRIRKCKSRWGSCSRWRNLNFNWLIMMAPPAIVDYVVVHELCHCHLQDHSPRFWELVESILPDYRLRKKWLRENSSLLVL